MTLVTEISERLEKELKSTSKLTGRIDEYGGRVVLMRAIADLEERTKCLLGLVIMSGTAAKKTSEATFEIEVNPGQG